MSLWLGSTLAARVHGGTAAGLAALHVIVAATGASYVADLAWGSAPLSASLTPLPFAVVLGAWIPGTLGLLVVGVVLAAGDPWGPSVGPDPWRVLPDATLPRVKSVWAATVSLLLVVAVAPLPVYLVLDELGAAEPTELLWPILIQLATILIAPLLGLAAAAARRPVKGLA